VMIGFSSELTIAPIPTVLAVSDPIFIEVWGVLPSG